ncbi:MAG: hypothetical protein KatS3mg062_1233 [Tepidiforma sp.]|nr:MAG: hypothetical protein KatS3mg062_1233 [Tepidiforma sp.]
MERRIPDPTLMARLQLSVKGVDWAAGLVRRWQHDRPNDGSWTPHQHVAHLLAAERNVFHVRVPRILAEERPVFESWDEAAHIEREYRPEGDIEELAEAFMKAREQTVGYFKDLAPEQWTRTAVWPGVGEVDLAWVAERALAHALEHFVALLNLHQQLDRHHARTWLGREDAP